MKFLVTLFMCLASLTGMAQWQWVTSTKGVISGVFDMANDPSGNILVTGSFADTAILGNTVIHKKNTGSNYDIFVAKLNSQGNFIWAKRIGPNSTTQTNNVVCDKWGNIYVTGTYSGWGSPDSVEHVPLTTPGVFIAKYDPNGAFIWLKEIPVTNYFEERKRLAVDTFGNIYYAGAFKDSFTIDNVKLFSTAHRDAFLLKLNTNGNLVWARSIGGKYDDGIANIAVDANANIYMSGYFSDTLQFAADTIVSASGMEQAFLVKYDPGGVPLFARYIPVYGKGLPIAIDASSSMYVAGRFGNSLTIDGLTVDPVSTDNIFLARYHSSGVIDWLKVAGSSKQPIGFSAIVARNGNFYVAGGFKDSATIGTDKLYSNVPTNIFLSKYSDAGNPMWTKTIKSTEYFYTILYSLSTDEYGTLYTGGTFAKNCFFDDMTAKADTNVINAFIAKLHAFTGLDETTVSEKPLVAYPNPSDGAITLDLGGGEYNRVEIFNMMGVRVLGQDIPQKTRKLKLDLEHLPSGSYYLKALDNHGKSEVVKILLTR
jgi:hypothetical protein